MKKILFVLSFALPLSMCAQKAPSAVQTAFKKHFPTVTKVDFDKEKNGEYEAEFKMNGVEMSANFTVDGAWRETETEIAATALPANVSSAISKKYPTAKVVGAAKIETADRGTLYEADLKTGMKKAEVLFDTAGNVVK
ncbi:MAG: PepSY-like domain-containing protein [Saprospiraceae bacterium]|nr:PepSY-like domain-containing protein [Saprospiraceae bacterium]